MSKAPHRLGTFERLARNLTNATGTTAAFMIALCIVLTWAALGPIFHFGDAWQLVINTGTTIVTFLMVFLIQRAQNKDSLALHLKLDELVAATRGASNRLVNVEDIGEEELRALHRHYAELAELAEGEGSLLESHSIDEARVRHAGKRVPRPSDSVSDVDDERRRTRG